MIARDEGYEIYAETCPHYLEFTKEVYKREDGRNFVCAPPMKGDDSKAALWDAIRRGDIDTVAADHCPFHSFEKDFMITNEKMHSDCDHTIWEGVTVHGYPVQTYSRGRLVYDDGKFVGERGCGKLIKRSLQ